MKLVSFSTKAGETRPGILFEDTKTILDLTPSGFKDTLDVISRAVRRNRRRRKNPTSRCPPSCAPCESAPHLRYRP